MADDETIDARVIAEVAKTFDKNPDEVTPQLRFKEDLAADSMEKFTLVAVAEELTGAHVTYGQMNAHKTVAEYIDWVKELQAS